MKYSTGPFKRVIRLEISHLRIKPRKKKHAEEDTGSDEYDGLFNNEPIDDTLPMEPELRVTDLREKAKKESLHLGHLKYEQKDAALKKYYDYNGTSKGIYF